MLRSSLLVSSLVTLCACHGGSGDARPGGLEYGSPSDVANVLASGGVSPPVSELTCMNPTSGGKATRAVACTVELTAAHIKTLEAGIPLATHTPVLQAHDGSCESRVPYASSDPSVRVLTGTNTRITNGIGRIEVHVHKGTPVACVEVEYPWSG